MREIAGWCCGIPLIVLITSISTATQPAVHSELFLNLFYVTKSIRIFFFFMKEVGKLPLEEYSVRTSKPNVFTGLYCQLYSPKYFTRKKLLNCNYT